MNNIKEILEDIRLDELLTAEVLTEGKYTVEYFEELIDTLQQSFQDLKRTMKEKEGTLSIGLTLREISDTIELLKTEFPVLKAQLRKTYKV